MKQDGRIRTKQEKSITIEYDEKEQNRTKALELNRTRKKNRTGRNDET